MRQSVSVAIGITALVLCLLYLIATGPLQAHNDTVINGACGPEAPQLLRDIDRRLVLLMSR